MSDPSVTVATHTRGWLVEYPDGRSTSATREDQRDYMLHPRAEQLLWLGFIMQRGPRLQTAVGAIPYRSR